MAHALRIDEPLVITLKSPTGAGLKSLRTSTATGQNHANLIHASKFFCLSNACRTTILLTTSKNSPADSAGPGYFFRWYLCQGIKPDYAIAIEIHVEVGFSSEEAIGTSWHELVCESVEFQLESRWSIRTMEPLECVQMTLVLTVDGFSSDLRPSLGRCHRQHGGHCMR